LQESKTQMDKTNSTPFCGTLCQGVNTISGGLLSTAVEGSLPKEATGGAKSGCSLSVCKSILELKKSLAINGSLSVGFGPAASVDQKLNFLQELNLTATSLVICVRAYQHQGGKTLNDVKFKNDIDPSKDLDDFINAYGDSYVSSITTGGEYIGLYVFYSQNSDKKTELEANLTAKGVFSSATVDTDLKSKLDEFRKEENINCSFKQMLIGTNCELPSESNFVEFALKFPGLKLKKPTTINYRLSGYETVPGLTRIFEHLKKNRASLQSLAEKLLTLKQIKNQIKWIKEIYKFYNTTGNPNYTVDATLNERKKVCEDDITAINNTLINYKLHETADLPTLTLRSLEYGNPVLAPPKVRSSPRWGGGGGVPFHDVDLETFLMRKTRMTEIGLRSGALIDRLTITYTDSTGKKVIIKHGGNGGSDQGSLQLLKDDTITEINGRFGSRLDYVYFKTKNGRELSGGNPSGGLPFSSRPGKNGEPWTLDTSNGEFVIGFCGKSGIEIDSLEVISATLQPAQWEELPQNNT
jgi:hypothetical protein